MNKKFGTSSIIDRDLILSTHHYCKVTSYNPYKIELVPIRESQEMDEQKYLVMNRTNVIGTDTSFGTSTSIDTIPKFHDFKILSTVPYI